MEDLKVANKKQRLMFESLIAQDKQNARNGIKTNPEVINYKSNQKTSLDPIPQNSKASNNRNDFKSNQKTKRDIYWEEKKYKKLHSLNNTNNNTINSNLTRFNDHQKNIVNDQGLINRNNNFSHLPINNKNNQQNITEATRHLSERNDNIYKRSGSVPFKSEYLTQPNQTSNNRFSNIGSNLILNNENRMNHTINNNSDYGKSNSVNNQKFAMNNIKYNQNYNSNGLNSDSTIHSNRPNFSGLKQPDPNNILIQNNQVLNYTSQTPNYNQINRNRFNYNPNMY